MAIRKADSPDLFEFIEEQNLLRQYDLLANCVDICIAKGIDAFDKYMLWTLNATAVANIAQFGGRFREQPIYVGDHIPPHFRDVPNHIDQLISFVHENWLITSAVQSPTLIPAYALWRLNWVHPFIEGNGRTARSVCYLLLCIRYGGMIPGEKSVPELIRENRQPYYAALKEADAHWERGHFDVDSLAGYLEGLLEAQLQSNGQASLTPPPSA